MSYTQPTKLSFPLFFFVLLGYAFWQGGFMFYAAIVVPIGTEQQTALVQGLITQRVTWWLIGLPGAWQVVVLVALVRLRPIKFLRIAWLGNCVLTLALIVVHLFMDGQIEREIPAIKDRKTFQALHITYLWFSTLQWAVALVMLVVIVRHDRCSLVLTDVTDRVS